MLGKTISVCQVKEDLDKNTQGGSLAKVPKGRSNGWEKECVVRNVARRHGVMYHTFRSLKWKLGH